jgi:hypothetical protein
MDPIDSQGQVEPTNSTDGLIEEEGQSPNLGDGFDDAFEQAAAEAAKNPLPEAQPKGARAGKKTESAPAGKQPEAVPAAKPEETGTPAPTKKEGQEAKPDSGKEPPAAQPKAEGQTPAAEPAKPKSALEEAEEAGRRMLGESGQEPAKPEAAKGAEEKPSAGATKGEGQQAGEAPKAEAAKGPAVELPKIELPATIVMDGQEYPLADVIADYGQDVVALSYAVANQAVQQLVTQGKFVQADQVNQQLAEMRSMLAWESHLNDISALSKLDARAVLKDPGYAEWLGKQSAGIQALVKAGTAEDCATVVRAYYDHLTAGRNKTEDQKRASEKQRREDIHRHTTRDSETGRFASGEGGNEGGDYESAFEEFAKKQA